MVFRDTTLPLPRKKLQSQSRRGRRSLRSKRFQSSYCAKVFFFFCSCPSFLDEPREETLATQARESEHKCHETKEKRTYKEY